MDEKQIFELNPQTQSNGQRRPMQKQNITRNSLPFNNIKKDVTGNAETATKLKNPVRINNVLFDGSCDIIISDNTKAKLEHKHTEYSLINHTHEQDHTKASIKHKHDMNDFTILKIPSDIIEQNSDHRFITDKQLKILDLVTDIYNSYQDLKDKVDEIFKNSSVQLKELNNFEDKLSKIDMQFQDMIKLEMESHGIEIKEQTDEEKIKEQLQIARNKLKDILLDEKIDELCEISYSKSIEKDRLKKEIVELTNKISPSYRRRRSYINC